MWAVVSQPVTDAAQVFQETAIKSSQFYEHAPKLCVCCNQLAAKFDTGGVAQIAAKAERCRIGSRREQLA